MGIERPFELGYPSVVELRRQRIHDAQRTGLRNRIRDHWHVPEERADALIDAWAREAKRRSLLHGDATYWHDAEDWIREQVKRQPSPAGDAEP
jgi:hypothetical protein